MTQPTTPNPSSRRAAGTAAGSSTSQKTAEEQHAAFAGVALRTQVDAAAAQAERLLGTLRALSKDHPEVLGRHADFVLAGTLLASVHEALRATTEDLNRHA